MTSADGVFRVLRVQFNAAQEGKADG